MGTELQQEISSGNGTTPSVARRTDRQTRRSAETSLKDVPRHYSETHGHEKNALVQSLGWFSIGLGLAELFAPRAVARLSGLDEDEYEGLLRAYGLRELIAGAGILGRPRPTYWMWNRVLGDTIDLVTLARARHSANDKGKLATATAAVLAVTALDIACSVDYARHKTPSVDQHTSHDEGSYKTPEMVDGTQMLSAITTINKPVAEVYAFWKNPQNYPRFMENLDSVKITGNNQAHWKIKAPVGMSVEWDATVINDVPNQVIEWRSLDSAEIHNTGTVRFRSISGDRTEVELVSQIKPKGGPLGAKIAKVFAAVPKTQLSNDLRRFKQLIEVGEIIKSDASAVPGMHPARPPRRSEMEATQ
ncbi:MAG TPA: SRPBCC family protein [Gemmatimonadaceae bacterium]